MNQQQKWENEYTTNKDIPTTTRTTPSASVVDALTYLEKNKLLTGKKVIDLGCGTGRNTVYVAERGYKCTAVDFSQTALNVLQKKVKESNLDSNITIVKASIGKDLPFETNSFDLALDIVSSLSLNQEEMKVFAHEVKRVVKQNGFLVSYVLSNKDEYYLKYGEGKGHYITPHTKIFEYCRSKDEILEAFEKWELVLFQEKEKIDQFYGELCTRRLLWLLLKNKK